MKRLKLCIVIMFVMVMFTGCAKTIDLTDAEMDMFAEYISKEVLARDKYYDQELLPVENDTVEELVQNTDHQKDETNTNQVQNLVTNNGMNQTSTGQIISAVSEKKEYKNVDVNEILGTSAIEVSYQSAKLYESYPEDNNSYFVISSLDGYQLYVVRFDLKNVTKKSTTYNMLKESVEYTLMMNTGKTYSPLLTLLVDDLQFCNKVIPANETQEGVLVFRIPESEVKSDAILKVVSGSKCATMEIK